MDFLLIQIRRGGCWLGCLWLFVEVLVQFGGSPSTTSVSISKETFFPAIFCWFREMIESSLKTTSLLRINFWFSRSHTIRICGAYCRSVLCLTIVSVELRALLLSMAKCWSSIMSFAMLRPKIPVLLRRVGALPSPSPGSFGWSVLPLHSAWVCIERSFSAISLSRVGTIWRLRRCILLRYRARVSSLCVPTDSLLRLTTERTPRAVHLLT